VLRIVAESGRELADLASGLRIHPQVLLNVRVARRPGLDEVPAIGAAVRAAGPDDEVLEQAVGRDGRLDLFMGHLVGRGFARVLWRGGEG